MPKCTATTTGVGLHDVLAAREDRAARQAAALARHGRPIVSITVVMPGPSKDGPAPRRVQHACLRQFETMCAAKGWRVLWREVSWRRTGPEALYVVDADAMQLKRATVELEDAHPLGRLWDIDVIAPHLGLTSRKALGLGPRPCLICEQPAFECGRSRRHALPQLLRAVHAIAHAYDRRPRA